MSDPVFATKCVKFLFNEIIPRAKKVNVPLEEFLPGSECGDLMRLEYSGAIDRRKTREILNERLNQLMNKEVKNEEIG